MTNPYFDSFIKTWKSQNFTGWNESDIREDFIAPLLKLLGYAKNTVDHIIREQNLNLQEKYHRIGRKQIAIDYIPTVRLKKFWIIEAKPGSPKEMNYGDLLQAHFYAIHPEINARFIVMINGWEIRVYDAYNSDDWDNYLLLCDQSNCETTFEKLIDTLGSNEMSAYLRKYILSTVKESLLVEVDVSLADSLKSEVNRIYYETIPIIRQNAQDLQFQEWRRIEKEENEKAKTIDIAHLIIHMDIPLDRRAKFGMEYARRITVANDADRHQLYKKMRQYCFGRPHNVFKVQVVAALLDLLRAGTVITGPDGLVDIGKDLEEIIQYNMSYWAMNYPDPIDNIGFALCHLDNICSRLSYKAAKRFGMESFKELVSAKNKTFSVKDLLINPPSVAKEVTGSVGLILEMLWRKAMEKDGKGIWANIWLMEDVEKIIDKIPEPTYPNGDHDLLWFDQYGIDFDILRVGTWSLMDGDKRLLQDVGLENAFKDLLKLTRDDVKNSMPPPLSKPENWQHNYTSVLTDLGQKIQELVNQENK